MRPPSLVVWRRVAYVGWAASWIASGLIYGWGAWILTLVAASSLHGYMEFRRESEAGK